MAEQEQGPEPADPSDFDRERALELWKRTLDLEAEPDPSISLRPPESFTGGETTGDRASMSELETLPGSGARTLSDGRTLEDAPAPVQPTAAEAVGDPVESLTGESLTGKATLDDAAAAPEPAVDESLTDRATVDSPARDDQGHDEGIPGTPSEEGSAGARSLTGRATVPDTRTDNRTDKGAAEGAAESLTGAHTTDSAASLTDRATRVDDDVPAPGAERSSLSRSAAVSDLLQRSGVTIRKDAGAFELVTELGRGGMGLVYRARQRSLGREVAIKTIRDSRRGRPGVEAKFLAEARVTGLLEHPNIVPVYELEDAAGELRLAMKLVGGRDWASLLEADRTLDELDADELPGGEATELSEYSTAGTGPRLARHLDILRQVCHAVAFAHSRSIVHLDLKPENVMVGDFGEVLVMDWGLALSLDDRDAVEDLPLPRREDVRSPIGTPVYMAPELAEAEVDRIDERTDVYLLGAILHELLTGRPPHAGDSLLKVLLAACESRPPELGPEVPVELAELCRRTLSRRPSDRPASVLEFREAIEAWQSHRESRLISRGAEALLQRCLLAVKSEESGAALTASGELDSAGELEARRSKLYADFTESLAGFRQALLLWPENGRAAEGRRDARRAFAEAALRFGDLALAEAQAAALTAEQSRDVQLEEAIQSARRVERERRRRFRLIRRGLSWSLAGLVVALVGGASWIWLERERTKVERDRARLERDAAEDARRDALRARDKAHQAQQEEAEARAEAQSALQVAKTARRQAEIKSARAEASAGRAHRAAGEPVRSRIALLKAHDSLRALELPTRVADVPLWRLFDEVSPALFAAGVRGLGITAMAHEPKGRRLAVAHASGLDILDLDTLQPVAVSDEAAGAARLVWSPDSDVIYALEKHHLRVLDATSGATRAAVKLRLGMPRAMIPVSGRRLAVSFDDGVILLFDEATLKVSETLETHRSSPLDLAFHAPTGRLASVAADARICVQDIRKGGPERPSESVLCPAGYARGCRFLADGSLLIFTNRRRLLHYPTGITGPSRELGEWQGEPAAILAGPGPRRVSVLTRPGRLIQFTIPEHDGGEIERTQRPLGALGAGAAVLHDEGRVLIIGDTVGRVSGYLTAPPPDRLAELHHRSCMDIAVTEDGGFIAVATAHAGVRTEGYKVEQGESLGSALRWKALRAAMERTIPRQRADNVLIYDRRTGRLVDRLRRGPDPGALPVFGVAFSPDSRRLAVGGLDLVIWDLEQGRIERTLGEGRRMIERVAFLDGGRKVLAIGERLEVFELASGEAVLRRDNLDLRVRSASLSNDGQRVVAVHHTKDRLVRIDLRRGRVRPVDFAAPAVVRTAISPDSRRGFALSASGTLYAFDLASGVRLWSSRALSGPPVQMGCPGGGLVAAIGQAGALAILDAETGELLDARELGGDLFLAARSIPGRPSMLLGGHETGLVSLDFASIGDVLAMLRYHQSGPKLAARAAPPGQALARWYADRGWWSGAERQRIRAEREGNISPDEALTVLLGARHDEAARERLDAWLEKDPTHLPAILRRRGLIHEQADRAEALLDTGRAAEAMALIRPCLKVLPERGRLWYLQGLARIHQGQPRKAVNNFNRAVKRGYEAERLFFWRGRAHQILRDHDAAITDFQRCQAMAPTLGMGFYGEGISRGQKRELKAALELFRKAVKLSPEQSDHHAELGLALAESGDPEAGRQALDEAVRLDGDNTKARMYRSSVLDALGDHRAAIKDLQHCLRSRPRDGALWAMLGSAFTKVDDFSRSAAAYQQAWRTGYRNPQVLLGWSESLEKSERYGEAEQLLRVLQRQGGELAQQAAVALARIAALRAGDVPGSKPLTDPADRVAWQLRYDYALAELKAGRPDVALKACLELDKIVGPSDPRQPSLTWNLACAYALRARSRPDTEAEEAAHDRDAAFSRIKELLALDSRLKARLAADEDLASLRSDPRWAEIFGDK